MMLCLKRFQEVGGSYLSGLSGVRSHRVTWHGQYGKKNAMNLQKYLEKMEVVVRYLSIDNTASLIQAFIE